MAETVEERPVHSEFNVATGEETHTPITDQEWADMRQREQDAIAAEKVRVAEEEALRTAVAAHPDPVVQALAKRAGLL